MTARMAAEQIRDALAALRRAEEAMRSDVCPAREAALHELVQATANAHRALHLLGEPG